MEEIAQNLSLNTVKFLLLKAPLGLPKIGPISEMVSLLNIKL